MEELNSPLEFRQLTPALKPSLAVFLRTLEENGELRHFHPHPFSDEDLDKLCSGQGEDLYYVAIESDTVLAYGMLRGWDEGYIVPSLGIAVHPELRGTGLAKAFMLFLHMTARRKGADQIRLKVYPDNVRAVALYTNLGYVFQGMENEQMIGRMDFN